MVIPGGGVASLDVFFSHIVLLELEGIQRMSARRKEQEQVRREATEDLAEDLSEGEKGDTVGELAPVETAKKKFQRNFSDLTVWSEVDNKEKKLYIVLIRKHLETMRSRSSGGTSILTAIPLRQTELISVNMIPSQPQLAWAKRLSC
ncbi:hypothetical protein ACP70R_002201 [Stipagrostis hirtigluma subsp. patula]